MMKSIYIPIIFSFFIYGCDERKEENTLKISPTQVNSEKKNSPKEHYELPNEQIIFIKKFNNVAIIEKQDIGTRKSDMAETQISEFKASEVPSNIQGWICKVIESNKFNDVYSIKCNINFSSDSDTFQIHFDNTQKYYKDDVIKINGIVSKESIFNNQLYRGMIIFVDAKDIVKIN